MEPLFLYCERLTASPFAEPLNTAACFGLLVAATLMYRMSAGLMVLRLMAGFTFLLFLTSVIVHMYPNALTTALVMVFILAVILVFFFGANRDILGLSTALSITCTALVLPFGAASLPLVALLPGATSSAAFAAFLILIWGYAVVLRPTAPKAAEGLFLGGLLLLAGLGIRSLDMPLCASFPTGTHFFWILCSALLLWHLARIYQRHMLAARPGGR